MKFMQKDTKIAAVISCIALCLLVLTWTIRHNLQTPTSPSLIIENGVQIIDLTAKGGFSPRFIEARAGIPTQLQITTNGTYDCSSSVVIPNLGYEKILEPTGIETIPIAAAQAQGTLEGTCGMGMYRFEIAFH